MRPLVRCIEALLIFMLGLMVVLVFGNVVLRYVFNSGLVFSEEVSRFLFIWLTLIGALLVMKERAHLGMTMLVDRLGLTGRKISRFSSDLVALVCCALLTDGTWKLLVIVSDAVAPVTGISMAWVYSSLLVCSAGMCLMLIASIYRQITGRIGDDEFTSVASTAGE